MNSDRNISKALTPNGRRNWLKWRWILLIVVLWGAGLICVLLMRSNNEPTYQGKTLSDWLVDVDYGRPEANRQLAMKAVRQMGTNALPVLLQVLRNPGSSWSYRVNRALQKIPRVTFRLTTSDDRLRRATIGIAALGPTAKPANPDLLSLLGEKPGYVPSALASIGVDAIPALQQCLTNTSSRYGQYVPGNTIGAIFSAISSGGIPRSSARVFIPQIETWAQSTNTHAARYAKDFLRDYGH